MNLGSIIFGFRYVSCSKNSNSPMYVLVGLCHDKNQQDELYNFSIHIWEEPNSILEEEEEDGEEEEGNGERGMKRRGVGGGKKLSEHLSWAGISGT